MPARAKTSSKNDLDRLSGHIESFQAGFRKLSKSASLKDLGRQFTGVLGAMFAHTTIDLLYRPAGSDKWEELVKGNPGG